MILNCKFGWLSKFIQCLRLRKVCRVKKRKGELRRIFQLDAFWCGSKIALMIIT